jgi:hypothetical protein
VNNNSSDACGIATRTLNQTEFDCSHLGSNPVTLTVTDNNGNTATATAAVMVLDTIKPTITCPLNILMGCTTDRLAPVMWNTPAATDNCGIARVECVPPSGSGFAIGATTVTCTATDTSGNTDTCSFTVSRAALGFDGFLAPIGGADSTGGSFNQPVRSFKMGSTIPVKFKATCGGAPVKTGVHTLRAYKYSNQTTNDEVLDATPQDAATTGNQFRLADDHWHFNLDTKATRMSKGIWLLEATLSDGSQHTVWIQLK